MFKDLIQSSLFYTNIFNSRTKYSETLEATKYKIQNLYSFNEIRLIVNIETMTAAAGNDRKLKK